MLFYLNFTLNSEFTEQEGSQNYPVDDKLNYMS